MEKKSILFILPDLNAGGAERIVTTIANHLPREKFSLSILLLRKEGLYLDFLQNDVEIIDIKTPRIRYALKPILKQIRKRSSTTSILQTKNMDRSRTRSPPDHKRGKTSKVLQQNFLS